MYECIYMKYNDIITVSRTDVRFVSSHRNVKFTIHRQPVSFEPRERVKNTHNAYELQLFFSNSVILVSHFFLFLSLDPSNFNGNARLWNININYISIQYLKRKTQTAYLLDLWWIYDIPRQPLRITTRNSNITRVMIFYSYLTCLLHAFCVVVFHLIYFYPIEFKFGVNGRE